MAGYETTILLTILFFFAFLGAMVVFAPPEWQPINAFDLVWFAGGILTVAGTCAIVTGIPCAGALAIFGIISLLQYVIINQQYLKMLFLPLVVIVVYIVSRLAKGGG